VSNTDLKDQRRSDRFFIRSGFWLGTLFGCLICTGVWSVIADYVWLGSGMFLVGWVLAYVTLGGLTDE
jgi:hypothetical protein